MYDLTLYSPIKCTHVSNARKVVLIFSFGCTRIEGRNLFIFSNKKRRKNGAGTKVRSGERGWYELVPASTEKRK
jgi:hypothetical protein